MFTVPMRAFVIGYLALLVLGILVTVAFADTLWGWLGTVPAMAFTLLIRPNHGRGRNGQPREH